MRRSNDSDPTRTALPTDGKATTIPAVVAPPPPQVEPVIPGTRLGRYELHEEIGRGGMGVVFRGRDPALSRPLAIKVLHTHKASARAQVRFLDEARAMARLRHPGVMPVFDVGRIGSHVYVVMPFVFGGTLNDWLVAAPRPWSCVVERFVAAGRGLAAAHAAGLVHRDFKPHNVLVDDDGSVLVADFGIAAHLHSEDGVAAAPVMMSTVAGTPAYMAPEQARGEAIDARADQYSFCVSLWEGLYGERPQQASTQTSVGRFATRELVVKPHHGTPQWLSDALLRGLAADPAERWPSMTALLDHLENRGRTRDEMTPMLPPRRRRWWAATIVVLVAMMALIAAIAATRGDDRAMARRDPEPTPATIGAAVRTTPASASTDMPAAPTRIMPLPGPAPTARVSAKRKPAPATQPAEDLSASRY